MAMKRGWCSAAAACCGLPLAYAIILPATYPLIIAMLLGFGCFAAWPLEFRWRDPAHRSTGRGITIGSLTAAIAQGITRSARFCKVFASLQGLRGGWPTG